MSRAVTANQIMFDECIESFRPHDIDKKIKQSNTSSSDPFVNYILPSFIIQEEIKCTHFTIYPTVRLISHTIYESYFAEVAQPIWTYGHNSHLYSIALSALVSFVWQLPVKSLRDDNTERLEINTRDRTVRSAGISFDSNFVIITAGPGAYTTEISTSNFERFKSELQEVSELLYSLPYKDYLGFIRAIRLVNLAQNVKRDDFGLSYYLLISAIETVAQIAISRDSVKPFIEQEAEWQMKAKQDEKFNELYKVYKESRGQNQYLNQRFVEFILKFCPVKIWSEFKHKDDYVNDKYDKQIETGDILNPIESRPFGMVYPSDLNEYEVRKMIEDMYKYRSTFTHKGESPPYRYPEGGNRYFDEGHIFDQTTGFYTFLLLPNFNLISFIAKYSILEYYRQKFSSLEKQKK